LDASMLLIADPRRAIGLAGVMGGANTEVTDRTTRVLLESAWFAPAPIRRTSRALGLRTDAAYRFERGADIEMLVTASARAAALIAELAGGTIARGIVDAYLRKRQPQHIRLRMSRVKRVLGVAPPLAQARKILAGLGLPVKARGAGLEVTVPSFRRDLSMEDDLVEEIIRVWGYDKLPSTLPHGGENGRVGAGSRLSQATLDGSRPHGPRYNKSRYNRTALDRDRPHRRAGRAGLARGKRAGRRLRRERARGARARGARCAREHRRRRRARWIRARLPRDAVGRRRGDRRRVRRGRGGSA